MHLDNPPRETHFPVHNGQIFAKGRKASPSKTVLSQDCDSDSLFIKKPSTNYRQPAKMFICTLYMIFLLFSTTLFILSFNTYHFVTYNLQTLITVGRFHLEELFILQ